MASLVTLARRLALSIEALVAIALALTIAAAWFRDPLTTRNFELRADQEGRLFDSYSYDDRAAGGGSVAQASASGLSWKCLLKAQYQWPYCGFGLLFDRAHQGRGLDLSKYTRIHVHLAYRGGAKLVRVSLKEHGNYGAAADGKDKVNEATLPLRNGDQIIDFRLADLAVADWWKSETRVAAEAARPSFHNIVAMEFVSGADRTEGLQQFQIRSITFERSLVSLQAFYAAIAALWMLLIAAMMRYRRKQIAAIRHSAQLALRASEQLYRGILEATTDMVVLLSPEGNVELVNRSGLAAMEIESADQVLGKDWTRLWRDPSAPMIADALDLARKGNSSRCRAFCPTGRGTPKWWDVVAAPMVDEQGSLKGLLTISRDVTEERFRAEQLKWTSEHDPLTRLPNRRAFQSRLESAVLSAVKSGKRIGLLLVDLDHFKHVNDTLGHSAGDDLLKSIAERLRHGVRKDDFVARIGGDEFAIIVEPLPSDEVLISIGDNLQSLIDQTVPIAGRSVRAGASIGGAVFPNNAVTAHDLFKLADTALYSLKQNGRGGTRLFHSYMLEEAQNSAAQLRIARGVVTDGAIVPIYQPKVNVADQAITGFEALLRWRHPRKGLQLPWTLEEAFGDYELAAKIGHLMHAKVASDIRSWLNAGIAVGRIAINAAPAEFLRDDYAENLLGLLEQHEVPAEQMEIEVTEHAFLGRSEHYVARALQVLKGAGANIALDDFGTGSSSLSHLRDFPVDVVKIDMSFVQKMTEDEEIAAIVAAVINLASSLSIKVVAEGVDNQAQLDLLRAMGCQFAQGHLFAPAVQAARVPRLLPRRSVAA